MKSRRGSQALKLKATELKVPESKRERRERNGSDGGEMNEIVRRRG